MSAADWLNVAIITVSTVFVAVLGRAITPAKPERSDRARREGLKAVEKELER